ncbi:MAG TPA: 3-hydroxybutyrate oligomer hydrolase family protein [Kofleriaceae bacterium]|nr:3-hydroxybutyrate oligomer hydrolase family protein [Kofleriaceae bacterium]
MTTKNALYLAPLVGLSLAAVPRAAHADCGAVLAALGDRAVDATCVDRADLTTANPATTPADNSIAGLPPGAFTPTTDRGVISPDAPDRTPITRAVPGLELRGRFAGDPTGQARWLVRLPADWNGRLVVAGASGTRSEDNGDFAWSDYVLQKGYAYASQNKGVLNLQIVSLASPTAPDATACRLNPASQIWVRFFDDDPAKPFTQWTQYMLEDARLARRAVEANYHRPPHFTYAVGTSNGGYQVRRAVEEAPELFDGGVDWEGTFIDPRGPNLLIDLPPAIANFAAYAASGFDPSSAAAQNILAAGYPPDLVSGTTSLWGLYFGQFWEVTQCQWQKRFDPSFATYPGGVNNIDGTGGYDFAARAAADPSIAAGLAAVATTGRIKRPLITVAGTMDGLLPIERDARAYAALVRQATCDHHGRHGDCDLDDRGRRGDGPAYRLYEVQNGNHIETFKNTFPQLELIQPHAQRAFDLLVDHVEHGAQLPPSQCVPRGGSISAGPSQPGHCVQLLAP